LSYAEYPRTDVSEKITACAVTQYVGIEWDAENRLLAINQGTLRSEFSYDGMGRRTKLLEKNGGIVVDDKRFVWCEIMVCEERNAAGAITKRFQTNGMLDGGTAYFYVRDHLGSVAELTDSTNIVRARYQYDAYGRSAKVSGDKDSSFGFTGHYVHLATGLVIAPFRAYDANLGRWLSEDPLGLEGGPNTYAYAEGCPVGVVDPLGLLNSRTAYNHYRGGTEPLYRCHFRTLTRLP
jgi:RHS repeat-associated protein